jgi:hypothetical protein
MIKHALVVVSVSLAFSSAGFAAPLAPTPQLKQSVTSDLIQVKKGRRHHRHGHHHGHHQHYKGRYWYGGRYWGRRYYYRPYYWQSWGCTNVGPIWYCP